MNMKSKVHVLHVTLNMEIGGTEQVIKQLVENTCLDKFCVTVLCIDGIVGSMGQELVKSGVRVISLKRKPGFDKSLIKDLRAVLKDQNVDVLHCHQYTPYTYGVFAAFGSGIPVIYTEHGRLYPETYKWKRFLINPVLSFFTESIVSISKATADALVKYENFPRSRIEVIYNGLRYEKTNIDRQSMLSELDVDEQSVLLGTVSRIDPIKNQPLMIKAFSKVLSKHPKAVLVIVGDGSDRPRLESLVRELGIKKSVRFTGFQVHPQPYFELLDIFLLSSLSEGTSMTLLESMACSKPSVVTDVGGNPEIVLNGETGFVTPDQDVDAFSQAMDSLLASSSLRESMGSKAMLRYRELFSEEKMLSRYEEKYLTLIK